MSEIDTEPDRIQFRVGPLEEDGLYDRLKPTGDSEHHQVRRMLSRYLWLMDASMPELSESEKNLICDITNSTWFGEPIHFRMLWASLADAEDEYYEKWDVDKEDLVDRARDWTLAEAMAVVDFTDQFWAENA